MKTPLPRILSRRILAARPFIRAIRPSAASRSFSRTSTALAADEVVETDPGLNGGYINPPAIKRQHRDAKAGWWDPQERRDYGEPVHEDEDVLGMFTTEDYTHFSAARGAALMGIFIASVFGLSGLVYLGYPDKPAAPRTYPGGLEQELGGPKAVPARKEGDTW